jgi:hypothetical protein
MADFTRSLVPGHDCGTRQATMGRGSMLGDRNLRTELAVIRTTEYSKK